ncbi:hypothetical protein Tco_0064826 [Tanacetum coccineum]
MDLSNYEADYNNEDKPIPFRRRVFPSSLDGKHIIGKNVEELIKSKLFSKLDDDDAVSLCCIGILQLVLLGVEDRHAVPNWILSLANDRDGWDDYPWGLYVWLTFYYQLRDANAFKLGDPKHIDWLRDVAANQGSRSIAWRIIKIEGPGLIDEERPRVLDPSPHHYIRRPPHSLLGEDF